MRDMHLDTLLAEQLATGEQDAESVAQAVLHQLDAQERDRIVRALVLDKARRSVAARAAARPRRPVAVPDPEPTPEEPLDTARRVAPVRLAPAAPPSAKVTGIRDWWTGFLTQEVQVGTRSKVMADCTAEDLEALARARMGTAQRMAKNARGMAALASQMKESGARTVKDLPRTRAQAALAPAS